MLKSSTVKILTSNSLPENAVTISSALGEDLGINPGHHLAIIFGSSTVPVVITNYHKSDSTLSVKLSKKVSNHLHLPNSDSVNLLFDTKQSTLHIGPLIGIFANRFEKVKKPFGEQTGFFRKLGKVAKTLNSYFFAFSPGDIDWDNKLIRGAIPKEGLDEWENLILPFPDVIYDRGLFPRGPRRLAATKARKILRNYPGIKFFNPAFFGKWKTHKLLSKHEILNNHLPDTKLYSSSKDLLHMMKKHRSLYLKPSGGSSGRGILKLTQKERNISINYRSLKEIHTVNFENIEEAVKYLESVIGNKRYIIQQDINLATIHGCPFDIRVIMQRDLTGEWKRTGIAARVAQKGSFISNIHAGGHAAKITELLKNISKSKEQANLVLNNIRKISALTAAWVTTEGNPLFGEFAMDIGIDPSGHVWIIELNAIPGRSVFRKIGAQDIVKKALARPIEYAYYLSGFNLNTTSGLIK